MESPTAEQTLALLKEKFGYDSFRGGQEGIIREILNGRDALGIMPTGGGKSLCYQLPSLLLGGVCIVISPLISLMSDQVQTLRKAGISAAYINSSLDAYALSQVESAALAGKYKLIYIAPERLDKNAIMRLAKTLPIRLVAVDEAHCISQWGQNFRPSYLKIAGFIEQIPHRPIVTAFTATATMRVRNEIVASLSLRDPYVHVASFDRPNLFLEVRMPYEKDDELFSLLSDRKGESGIIYCMSRSNVEAVTDLLSKRGYPATRYHAGLKLEERKQNQEAFLRGKKPIMVATNAFGMGIDKPDVRFVIHYNLPMSVEAYYQEVGRAGRDGKDAYCCLLYNKEDLRLCRFLIEMSAKENKELTEEQRASAIEKDEMRLKEMTRYAYTQSCLRRFILAYFSEASTGRCHKCSVCNNKNAVEVDVTDWARAVLNCVYQICAKWMPYGKAMLANVLEGSEDERVKQAGLDKLRYYGALRHLSRSRISELIERLIEDDCLSVSTGEYPVITLGPASNAFRDPQYRYTAPLIRVAAPLKISGGEEIVKNVNPDEALLFVELRSLRKLLAEKEGKPAFVVFSDSVLWDMCRVKPKSEAEFLSIPGIGKVKLNRYGEAFMNAIIAYEEGLKESERQT